MPARKAPRNRKPPAKTAAGRKATAARSATRVRTAKAAAKPRSTTIAKTTRPASKRAAKPAAKPVTRPAPKPAGKARPARPALPPRAAVAEHQPAAPAAPPKARSKPRAAAVAVPVAAPQAVHPPVAPPVTAIAVARAASRPRPQAMQSVLNEDDEERPGHNLLLGPRNVRPYLERSDEAYMSQQQLAHFRTILNSWKRDLMEEVDRTMNHMKDEAANPPDPNDRASLESEFALELRTRDRERKLIRKIEEALGRIDDGSYGYCLETGEPIGVKRLEARPVATLCIEAQERRERREKQYGDRDDWYR